MSVLPLSRRWRRLIAVAVIIAIMVVLWIWVFPWVDSTYVNRPAIEEGMRAATPA